MRKFFFIVSLTFVSYTVSAQKVFSVDQSYKADVKVFVVDQSYKADLLVFRVDAPYKAGKNDGKWFFTDANYTADKEIYFVDAAYKADSSLLELPDFGCGHSRSVMIPSSPELDAASDASDALGELRSGADSRTMPPPSGLPSSPRSPVVDRGVCLFLTLLVDL